MLQYIMSTTYPVQSRRGAAVPAFILVPDMHPWFVPCRVPLSVAFFHPGLPGVEQSVPGHTQERLLYLPANYPFSPRDAQSVLRELLELGQRMDATLRSGGPQGLERPELAALRLFPEGADLDREVRLGFSAMPEKEPEEETEAEHTPPETLPGKDGKRATPSEEGFFHQARVAAQKTLLLTWDLEERLEEIQRLREKVNASGLSLSRLLGEGQSQEEMMDAMLTAFAYHGGYVPGSGAGVSRPDWKITLAAMAPFLPPAARLFACHRIMEEDLEARGLLRLVHTAGDPVLGAFPSPLFLAEEPLWRLLGRSAPPEGKPWLLETVRLYMHRAPAEYHDEK